MNKTVTKQETKTAQYEKPEFERLVDEFLEADKRYTIVEEQFLDGRLLREILGPPASNAVVGLADQIVDEFRSVVDEMKKLLEDRNAKLALAKNALRAAVQAGENQFRGPGGKSSVVSYGGFTASSVTRRSLNAEKLMKVAEERGFLSELKNLQAVDKSGVSYQLVETKLTAEYEGISTWLKQRGLDEVVSEVYEERDVTPAVKGPKKLAFLGEKKDD